MNQPQIPRMRTIRETASLGILPEYALRQMAKAGTLPCIYCGKKALVNVDRLIEMLNALGGGKGGVS